MTPRYQLLIDAMHAASEAVLLTALFAAVLLAFRAVVRMSLASESVPVFFRTAMYNVADLLFIGAIYAPILLAK